MFHCYLILFLVSIPIIKSDFALHIIYSEVKPFVYKNEQGKIDGIIPRQYENAIKVCKTLSGETFHLRYLREETYNVFHEKLFQINMTVEEIFAETNKSDYNSTQLELAEHVPFYYPYFKGFNKESEKLQQSGKFLDMQLQRSNHIAIIMRRRHISLIRKALNGIASSSSIVFLVLLFVIAFTIILTLLENCHNFFRGIQLPVLLTNAWLTIVTCTTVGYGDQFPVTKIGKLISFFWITISLIMVCIFTAAVSGSVFGDLETQFEGKQISVLNNSYEAEIIAENYPKSEIVLKKSYKNVTESVISGDVIAGFLNADYAAWIQDELRDKNVHIVQLIDYEISINGVTKYHKDNEHLYNCMQQYKKIVLDLPIMYFRKKCEPEKIYYDSVAALYKENWYVPTLTAVILFFISAGVVHEILACRRLCLDFGLVQERDEIRGKESDMYKYGSDIEKSIFSLSSDITNIKNKLNKTKYGFSAEHFY